MSNLLTQNELAQRIADANGLSLESAKKFVTIFYTIVKRELKRSDSFYIANFGTFRRVWVEESEGINPATGEKITVPAHYRIRFTPSAAVAQRINRRFAHLRPKLLPDPPVAENPSAEESRMPAPEPTPVAKTETIVQTQEPSAAEEKKGVGKIIVGILAALFLILLLLILLLRGCRNRDATQVPHDEPALQPAAPLEQTSEPDPEPIDIEPEPEPAPLPEPEQIPEPEPAPLPEPESIIEPKRERVKKADATYTVPSGENYHRIAEKQYGIRHLWPCIYTANKEKTPNPDLIPVGTSISLPQIESVQENRLLIQNAMMEAFEGYRRQIAAHPDDLEDNEEKRRLAAGVLASAEILYPGFIDAHSQIPSDYAQYAKKIIQRNYPDYQDKTYEVKK